MNKVQFLLLFPQQLQKVGLSEERGSEQISKGASE